MLTYLVGLVRCDESAPRQPDPVSHTHTHVDTDAHAYTHTLSRMLCPQTAYPCSSVMLENGRIPCVCVCVCVCMRVCVISLPVLLPRLRLP